MEAYYYSHMNKNQQNVYQVMKRGLSSLEPSFQVPRVDSRELSSIFFRLRLDCPEIFWAVGFQFRFYQDSGSMEFVPKYMFDKGKVKEHQRSMESRVRKLARPAAAMTEWEKELYIHDFICSSVRYDKLEKSYSHEILGPLGQGVGVCEGISKAVKILCDTLGIWCIMAVSGANPDKGIKYRHAWNIVRIKGKYYHLDATFDNSLSCGAVIRYDYFNTEDKQIFRDHEPVIYEIPTCNDGTYFYYRVKKLSFTRTEDVEKQALQAIRKDKPFIFHWRGSYLTREMLTELLQLLEQTARQKGRHARIGLNWPQTVLQVSFVEEVQEEAVIVEEANQGEAEGRRDGLFAMF